MAWLLGVWKSAWLLHTQGSAYSKIHDPVVESGGEGDLVELDVFGLGLEVSFFRSIGAKKSLPSSAPTPA